MGRARAALVIAVPLLLGAGSLAATALGQSPSETSAQDPFYKARSQGVQELAASLNTRERELDARERSIEDRERKLRQAEQRLDERLAELEALRGDMEGMLTELEAEREQRILGLVRWVESVRAVQAAPIVALLDDELAVEVLTRMNRTKAGKLLAAMSPTEAARLAEMSTQPVRVSP